MPFLKQYPAESELLLRKLKKLQFSESLLRLDAGGKPSTWFPPGRLVEQSIDKKQNNKDEDEDDNDEDEDQEDEDKEEDEDEDEDGDGDGDRDSGEDGDEDQDEDGRR